MSTQAYQSGFLKVSNTHQLYYEAIGNQKATPILFLHGGPGAGFSDKDKRFFNFKKHHVIFFDQRGASKSIPFASIQNNTTNDLIKDINFIVDHFNFQKVHLFGGSWGTTLALCFSIQFPQKIKSLLLRGVFINDKACYDHYLNGDVAKTYPNKWKRFINNVPLEHRHNHINYYWDKICNGTPAEKEFFSYEFSFYEISIFKLSLTDTEVASILKQMPYQSLGTLEIHYIKNLFFIGHDYILNNTHKIIDIPINMVHGKQDSICLVASAEKLHEYLEHSNLYIVPGGHSDSEPKIEQKLIEVLNTAIYSC